MKDYLNFYAHVNGEGCKEWFLR